MIKGLWLSEVVGIVEEKLVYAKIGVGDKRLKMLIYI